MNAELFERSTCPDNNSEHPRCLHQITRLSNVLLVYAQGTPCTQGGSCWNAGACCSRPVTDQVDDIGYLLALRDWLHARLLKAKCETARRYWAVGHGNGALMAARLACEGRFIDGTVMVGGGFVEDPQRPGQPKGFECLDPHPQATLIFHGTDDTTYPYQGCKACADEGRTDLAPMTTRETFWALRAGCETSSRQTTPPVNLVNEMPETSYEINYFEKGCETKSGLDISRSRVQSYRIVGHGHSWPKGSESREKGGTISQEIEINSLMIRWLRMNTRARQIKR